MSKKIFISYANQDKEFAARIEKKLEEKGNAIWRDTERLTHAIMWNQDITNGILNSDCVILIWSSHAKSSVTVHHEITSARALLKPIVVIKVTYEKKVERLPEEIKLLQVIRQSNFDDVIDELLKRITDIELDKIKYPINPNKLNNLRVKFKHFFIDEMWYFSYGLFRHTLPKVWNQKSKFKHVRSANWRTDKFQYSIFQQLKHTFMPRHLWF